MIMIIIKSNGKYGDFLPIWGISVTHAELNREPMKGKIMSKVRVISQLSGFPKSIPCDDILAALCIRVPNTVGTKKQDSATMHLPLSLLIYRGSCMWQRQWQVTGATKMNHLLPSTANKCEHLPSHILTYTLWMHSPGALDFNLLTNEE